MVRLPLRGSRPLAALPETAGTGPPDELSVSPDREAMWAHERPSDVATEIYGVIEAVLMDEIRPAIEYLEAASRVTAEELSERFEGDRGR
jgi:hypothetical protein